MLLSDNKIYPFVNHYFNTLNNNKYILYIFHSSMKNLAQAITN